MKPVRFDYVRARSAAHAVECLGAAAGFAKAIAGGQSLGPMLNLRLVEPDLLVDVRTCADLRGCRDDGDGDAIVYGAAVTHAEIEDGAVPALPRMAGAAARRIAYRAVRNRGTIGGSIAHADPARNWLVVLLALGAEVIGPARTEPEPRPRGIPHRPFSTALADKSSRDPVERRSIGSGTAIESWPSRPAVRDRFCWRSPTPTRGVARGARAIERPPIVLDDLSSVSDTGRRSIREPARRRSRRRGRPAPCRDSAPRGPRPGRSGSREVTDRAPRRPRTAHPRPEDSVATGQASGIGGGLHDLHTLFRRCPR